MRPALFACSPRPGGNSDQALELFAQTVREQWGEPEAFALRDMRIEPCNACGSCERKPLEGCAMADGDAAQMLLDAIRHAPFTCFASPIYFYHVPAHFKALIDRGQSAYMLACAPQSPLADLPPRRAYTILVAARTRGEFLFEGTLRTLRLFLDPFNITLAEPLLLRGIEGPKDFRDNEAAREAVLAYARDAVRREQEG